MLNALRPAVVALIASAGLTMIILAFWGEGGFVPQLSALHISSVVLFFAALFILRKWKLSPIMVMAGCGVIGGLLYFIP